MTQPQSAPALPRPLITYLRPLAMAAGWLALVGVASGFFFAPRAVEDLLSPYQVGVFVSSLGLTGAAAATIAFWIGGRRRWAVELTLAVTILVVIAAALLIYFLWLDPTFARQKMNLWTFKRLQQDSRDLAVQFAGDFAPLGVMLGIALGTIVGFLTIVGRQRPRLASGLALAIVFTFASTTGRQFVFDQLKWLHGYLLYYLLAPGIFYSFGQGHADPDIPITGMIFGGTAGSMIAGFALYATRPRPSVLTTATPDHARST